MSGAYGTFGTNRAHSTVMITTVLSARGWLSRSWTALSVFGLCSIAQLTLAVTRQPSQVVAVNSICSSAHLQHFAVNTVNGDLFENPIPDPEFGALDYCLELEKNIPPPILTVIRHVGELNSRVAQVLGISWTDLRLPHDINLSLIRHPLGSFASNFYGQQIIIGVFPDWNSGNIPDGVYVHELGHLLSMAKNNSRIGHMPEMAESPLIRETIADLIAMATVGTVTGNLEAVSDCFEHVRYYTNFQSYNASTDGFYYSAAFLKIGSCCQIAQNQFSKNPDLKGLCETVPKVVAGMKSAGMWRADNKAPLDPSDYSANPSLFDPHQSGIPVNSFFLDLKEHGVKDIYQQFLSAYSETALAPNAGSKLVCSVPLLPTLFKSQTLNAPTLRDVLEALRQKQTEAPSKALFDQAWQDHGLDKVLQMAESEGLIVAYKRYQNSEYTMAQSGIVDKVLHGDLRPDNSSPCWTDTTSPNITTEIMGCGIFCKDPSD